MAQLPDDLAKADEHEDVTATKQDLARAMLRLELVDQMIIEQTARDATLQDIGKIVNLSPGQVSKRRQMAITKLREILKVA